MEFFWLISFCRYPSSEVSSFSLQSFFYKKRISIAILNGFIDRNDEKM
jgi:hypothetical protein